ncbi:signal transduction response regulator [Sulfurihydrogenibium azorense Az-Fu1]|jgi:diguanylate cyclase (GGDEF)-like protein|uniref:Signal transduction response regulator n=1 Tax=Sulfurihydrogenibium azorense (strain DSM 15241 / OCM 825 / Az-Fu1) TaxID=204536 RepID=C1DTJ9_SULAA|nr:EAL domain-containing protein [Sulfurihydrogenibium azorense]ACN98194.1 signal transduction response regulator [Sulfurihydrogenibium azorense Az-Fu1]
MNILEFFNKRKNEEEKYIDKTTGAYNRDYIDIIEKDFLKKRYAFLLIDVDNLSNLLNIYGKEFLELILRDLVSLIKRNIRENDKIIRVGHDEFLILLEKDGNDTNYLGIAEKIVSKVAINPFFIIKDKVKITVSAGLYINADKEKSFEDAFKKADKALLLAKEKGKNRVELYSDRSINLIDRRLSDIKEAILENRVICFYQPIFNVQTFKTFKYESLVRILTKERKIILPGMFLNSIKGSHVYKELTRKMLEFNFSILNRKNINISVNLLPSDILDEDILKILLSLGKNLREKVTIELLESESVSEYSKLRDKINTLKDAGYKIALDDFGSGYSNILHIVELSFDYIKIDGQIIRKIDKDSISYSAVKAIRGLTKELNIPTVAEFISSQEIFDKVKELGIDYGQGYFFKEPINLSEIQ